MKIFKSSLGGAIALTGAIAIGALTDQAQAQSYAYMTNLDHSWGIVNLTNGSYANCGSSAYLLQGLAEGPTGTIYASSVQGAAGSMLWVVNPSNGALTPVAAPTYPLYGIGSTRTGRLYGLDANLNLYAVNPVTAKLHLIGSTGLTRSAPWSVSNGGPALYMTVGTTLYKLNLTTGAATPAPAGTENMGGLVWVAGKLYGGSGDSPPAIYHVNTITGADVFVATIGVSSPVWGLAPTPTGATGVCPTTPK